MIPLGYVVGLEKLVHAAIVYNKIDKSLKGYFKSDQSTQTTESNEIQFDFTCAGRVNIGRNNSQDNMILEGEITYVKIFTFVVEEDEIWETFSKPVPKPIKPKDPEGDCGSSSVLKSTIDRRKCVAPCTRDTQPPNPEAPFPPEEARIAQSPLGPGSDSSPEEEEGGAGGAGDAAKGDQPAEEENNGPSMNAISLEC